MKENKVKYEDEELNVIKIKKKKIWSFSSKSLHFVTK